MGKAADSWNSFADELDHAATQIEKAHHNYEVAVGVFTAFTVASIALDVFTSGAATATTVDSVDEGVSMITQLAAALNAIDNRFAAEEIDAASAAISITSGVVYITKAGVAAMTLAAPASGLPSTGGNDAQELTIVSTTAYAHTVTTPSNVINGANHVLTFTAAAGTQVKLMAKGGVWYVEPSAPGIAIT